MGWTREYHDDGGYTDRNGHHLRIIDREGRLVASLRDEHSWQTVTDSRGGEADYCAGCQTLDTEEEVAE